MRFLLLPIVLSSLNAWPALAQDSTEAPADEAAEAQPAEDTAPPPPPDYNGMASGTVIGGVLNTRVVCTIQGDSWTVQSDPGDAPSEDTNGDGNMVNITADRASGDIFLNVLAAGLYLSFEDTGAQFDGNRMRYAITASITGGDDERIEIEVVCN